MTRIFCTIALVLMMSVNMMAQVASNAITTECFLNTKPNEAHKKGFGSLSVLKGQKCVNCSFDYHDAILKKTPLMEASDDFYAETIDASTTEINERLIKGLTDKLEDVDGAPYFSNKEVTKYCLKAHALKADKRGNTELYAILIDTETCEVVYERFFFSAGGKFGTLVNLLGDGAESFGKQIAKEIAKSFK